MTTLVHNEGNRKSVSDNRSNRSSSNPAGMRTDSSSLPPQGRCPFTHRVPLEVRELIYNYYFDWTSICVIDGPPFSYVFELDERHWEPTTVLSWTQPALQGRTVPPLKSILKNSLASSPSRPQSLGLDKHCRVIWKMRVVGLLLTCRMFYHETLPILYGRSKFSFFHLRAFDLFAESLLRTKRLQLMPSGLQFLRSIQLHAPSLQISLVRGSKEQRAEVSRFCVHLECMVRRATALEEIEVSTDSQADRPLLKGYLDRDAGENCVPMLKLVLCLFQLRGLKVLRLTGGVRALRYELEVLEELLRPVVCQPRGTEADWRAFNVGFTEKMLERPYESQMG